MTGRTKKYYLFVSALFTLFFLQCATAYKVTYNIPPEYTGDRREELLGILDRGKALYKANCSECHGIFTKGKDKIPNFTSVQLDNYSSKFIRKDPTNHAVAVNMEPGQLTEVLLFLRYKKRDTTGNARH